MYKITNHPILDIPQEDLVEFLFEGTPVRGQRAILSLRHFIRRIPIHQHSLLGRHRSMECGIGKCGACEMLVDGTIAEYVSQKLTVSKLNVSEMQSAGKRVMASVPEFSY